MAGEFSAAGERIILAAMRGIREGAEKIMGEADVLIPKDTLTAIESGRIGEVVDEGTAVSITFGYGYGGGVNPKTLNPISEYIVPLHEILEAHHDPPTQAKFLEEPLFLYAAEMEADLGAAIEAELRTSGGRSL